MATDAMIDILAEQVLRIIVDRKAVDVQGELEVLKTRLDLTKALLAAKESWERKKQVIKVFLKIQKELVYEVDNILIDCLVEGEYQKAGSSANFAFKPIFWYQTGKKLKEINAKMEISESLLGKYWSGPDMSNHGDNPHQILKHGSQYPDPSKKVGLEADLQKLKAWMFGTTSYIQRIGIIGMGGLGKTTIAREIFVDKEVANHFEQKLWVLVSQTSSPEVILGSMLEQLDPDYSLSDEDHMLQKFGEVLRDKTCLVVMDDVWETSLIWCDRVCSCLQKVVDKRSCVIITTRIEEVATGMGVDKSHIHRSNPLNENESWLLFSRFAFPRFKGKCPPADRFEKVGKEILGKCGGLPLAIKTVAVLLAPKADSLLQWNEINRNFHQLTVCKQFDSVMASLQLSYDKLPPQLKQCLLCFSIYPEDFEIPAEGLVHWWVGEGLVHSKGLMTAKEVGFDYLYDLATRCFIEVVHRRDYDGRVHSCRMHSMVRALIIKIAEEESFGCFDKQSRQILAVETRWLGFTSEMDPKSLKNSSNVRALLFMSGNIVGLDRDILPLSSLRVLDFSVNRMFNISVEELLAWVCSLKRLAYLNLSGFLGLKNLPPPIQNLRNLQILILGGCSNLVKLNPIIITLKKLVIMDLGSCGLHYLPKGIAQLVHLQELSGFRVTNQANKKSCRFMELKELQNLRILKMNLGKDSEISEIEMDVLSKLEKLKVLSIDTEDCAEERIQEMLNGLSPPPNLQEFYLRRYNYETLPTWINPDMLSRLQYLSLENGDIVQLQTKGQRSHSRWNIEGLRFKLLPKLKLDWKNLVEEMPLLRYAEVSGCFNLQNFPCPDGKLAIEILRKKNI